MLSISSLNDILVRKPHMATNIVCVGHVRKRCQCFLIMFWEIYIKGAYTLGTTQIFWANMAVNYNRASNELFRPC